MSPTINPVEYTEKKYQDLNEINVVRELNNNPELVWFWRKFQLQRGDIVLVFLLCVLHRIDSWTHGRTLHFSKCS